MKNKNLVYFALIICLSLMGYYLVNSDSSVTRTDRRDFAVADTSEVIKVVLTSKVPQIATLERISEGEWSVNGTYKARKSGIFYLLKTLQRMEIAHPVPLSMRDNVLGNLAVKGIKVEIFLKNGEKKTLYVGGENQELTATFMMIQNATDPYAIHIPGFKGYLSSRFYTQEFLWRDKTVMNYDNLNIASVDVQYHDVNQKQESFHLSFNDNSYSLNSWNKKDTFEVNEQAVQAYSAAFRKLFAEAFVSGSLNTDSLLKTSPILDLQVRTKDNKETHVKLFHKKAAPGTMIDGDITMRDPERMYAFVNNEDWMIVQNNSFSKVIKTLSELKK